MPIGIQRLNARHQPPTPHILFLKPLPGPSATTAESFLARIAALMHPILRTHHLSVTSLDEFPANREFVGRNFNAGECVQLVLRRRRDGGWLPFRAVAMVMVHELAHNLQMNHGRAFWAVRNEMAAQLRGLWARGYTGEGVWGRGRGLEGGEWMAGGEGGEEELPTQVCGGVYRSRRRGRKRKAKEGLSWKEREERRVRRKFGEGGVALGDDEMRRRALEKGGWGKGKPRVAGSKRGRELRVAAALARFGQQKVEEAVKKEEDEVKKEEEDSEGGSTTDGEDEARPDAEDLDGSQMVDSKGHAMIKVCEDEDGGDVHVKEEMDEILDLQRIPLAHEKQHDDSHTTPNGRVKEEKDDATDLQRIPPEPQEQRSDTSGWKGHDMQQTSKQGSTGSELRPSKDQKLAASMEKLAQHLNRSLSSCPICSLENDASAWICGACSNVLKPQLSPGHWKCASSSCVGSSYVNAGDCGVCGVCASRKPV